MKKISEEELKWCIQRIYMEFMGLDKEWIDYLKDFLRDNEYVNKNNIDGFNDYIKEFKDNNLSNTSLVVGKIIEFLNRTKNTTDEINRIKPQKQLKEWINEHQNKDEIDRVNNYWTRSLENAKSFLNILSEHRESNGEKTDKELEEMISSINDIELRYICELIQNADDCIYEENKGTITFSIYDDYMLIHYDEKGFTYKDMLSITTIDESTKSNDATKTGEMGIGFKTAFIAHDEIEILSNYFAFKFSKSDSIFKVYINEENNQKSEGTSLKLKLKSGTKADNIYNEIKKFFNLDKENLIAMANCNPVLFTKKLHKFELIRFNYSFDSKEHKMYEEKVTVEVKETEYGKDIHSFKNDNENPKLKLEKVSIDNCFTEKEIEDELENIKARYSSFSWTNKKEEDFITAKEIIEKNPIEIFILKDIQNEKEVPKGHMYTSLPTSTDLNIPFYINAPFKLIRNRACIDKDVSWNITILKKIFGKDGIISKWYEQKAQDQENYSVFKWIPKEMPSNNNIFEYHDFKLNEKVDGEDKKKQIQDKIKELEKQKLNYENENTIFCNLFNNIKLFKSYKDGTTYKSLSQNDCRFFEVQWMYELVEKAEKEITRDVTHIDYLNKLCFIKREEQCEEIEEQFKIFIKCINKNSIYNLEEELGKVIKNSIKDIFNYINENQLWESIENAVKDITKLPIFPCWEGNLQGCKRSFLKKEDLKKVWFYDDEEKGKYRSCNNNKYYYILNKTDYYKNNKDKKYKNYIKNFLKNQLLKENEEVKWKTSENIKTSIITEVICDYKQKETEKEKINCYKVLFHFFNPEELLDENIIEKLREICVVNSDTRDSIKECLKDDEYRYFERLQFRVWLKSKKENYNIKLNQLKHLEENDIAEINNLQVNEKKSMILEIEESYLENKYPIGNEKYYYYNINGNDGFNGKYVFLKLLTKKYIILLNCNKEEENSILEQAKSSRFKMAGMWGFVKETLKELQDNSKERNRDKNNAIENIQKLQIFSFININKIRNNEDKLSNDPINELLQNINDHIAENGKIKITNVNQCLEIIYEEREKEFIDKTQKRAGFTAADILGITAIGQSVSAMLNDTTGFKGTGFKSLYGTFNRIEVKSYGYHFILDDNIEISTEELNLLGYQNNKFYQNGREINTDIIEVIKSKNDNEEKVPKNNYPIIKKGEYNGVENEDTEKTIIKLDYKENNQWDFKSEPFKKKLIFLDNIKNMKIDNDFTININRDIDSKENVVDISSNFTKYTYKIEIDDEILALNNRFNEQYLSSKFNNTEYAKVELAFSNDSNDSGNFYCKLPINNFETKNPCYININALELTSVFNVK